MDLRQLERERLQAIVSPNSDRLETLHHPDFLLCNPSGGILSRSSYLSGLCDGSIKYARFEPVTAVEVIQHADLGVVRYRSVIDISIRGGPMGHLECWHLDVYTRDEIGGWRCRWSQATDTIQD